jgi:hypothetical protein
MKRRGNLWDGMISFESLLPSKLICRAGLIGSMGLKR